MKIYKTQILNIALSTALLFCITSCISNSDVVDKKSYPLVISISDAGFSSASGSKATTRATESGYVTTFAKGDKIGLYVVNGSNVVETANLCLTYDGTNWNYPTGSMVYYNSTSKYFAYYPYQSTLTGAPTNSTATDAATFFATAISDWAPATDQSSQAKYTASDLMVGTGTAGTLYSNATRAMSFSMSHEMALVDMNFPYYYLSTDNSYTYTLGLTCSGFKPYHVSKGNYRYIIKPATSTSIWGYYCTTTSSSTNQIFNKAVTVAAGTYQTMNVDNTSTSTSHTLAIGDYYLNDGGVIPNATTNSYLLAKAIGVIFSTRIGSEEKQAGYTHGYVMALNDVSANVVLWGPYTSADDTPLSNITTESDYYNDLNSGYEATYTDKIFASGMANSSYPAFKAAKDYSNTVPTPSICSGWYLPSTGHWWDLVANLGSAALTTSMQQSTTDFLDANWNVSYSFSSLNKYFTYAGGSALHGNWYWASSEYSYNIADGICFINANLYLGGGYKYDDYFYARSILSF